MTTSTEILSQEERDGWIAFNLAPEIGGMKMRAIQERFGSSRKALGLSPEKFDSIPGLGSDAALAASRARLEEGRKERDRAEAAGVRVLCWQDPEFPSNLRNIDAAPGLIYVKGSLAGLTEVRLKRAVAVVGTRKATAQGCAQARRFGRGLAEKGAVVISGLALGVDGEAHAGCLEAGGVTIAVLAHGLSMVYPQNHGPLLEKILAGGGAAVSEYPMLMRPQPQYYPARNRIISGLSRGVLAVEAGESSGALITLDFGFRQDRGTYVLPGRLDDPQSRGCLVALRDLKAQVVLEPTDVLEDMERRAIPRGEAQRKSVSLSGEDKDIYEALAEGPLNVDQLSLHCGLDIPRLFPALLRLEMTGLVKTLPGQVYARAHS